MISEKYNPKKIEKKWRKVWDKEKLYQALDFSKNKKLYTLVEFPYPSGEGLHVGHAFTFTLMDVFARKKRMQGFNVLYPMGWDAFGLPTENYAIRTGVHPKIVTRKNTKRFKEQMKDLGFAYNWDREVNTTDPDYYKWTQWIFIQLFKKGLAYKKEMKINWCPSCKIGLANEEVVDGKCERCGKKVSAKKLSQWLLRITKYADRLADELDLVDFPESVVASQRTWIGRSEGIEIKFPLVGSDDFIPVFTTRPDTIFGVTFFVLAPEHKMVKKITKPDYKKKVQEYVEKAKEKMELERISETKEKTGVFTGAYVRNPANNRKIPIYVADFVVMNYGTGAVMGVPAHDQRDFYFARKHNLSIIDVIKPKEKVLPRKAPLIVSNGIGQQAFTGKGVLINSDRFNGMDSEIAVKRIGDFLQKKGLAQKSVQYHLRDWIFSRQHYWGEPIPMIYCSACAQGGITFWDTKAGKRFKVEQELKKDLAGWFPVSEQDLPVKLPNIKKYKPTGTGKSPLASVERWVKARCPVCKEKAERETDTMPNWAGSSWYFLRYCDSENKESLADKKKLKYWMPIDIYLGGAEHTTLHLLYSRFWHKFLNDIRVVPKKEPYKKRRVHGVILGEDGKRMSKSRGNVIVPEQMIKKFGADILRIYLNFIGPYDGVFPWNTAGVKGTGKFCQRFWDFCLERIEQNSKKTSKEAKFLVNNLIKDIGEDIDDFKFNTAIAKFMKFLNEIEKEEISKKDLGRVLKVLAPFAPFITEEIWRTNFKKSSIHKESWPKYSPTAIKKEIVTLVVEINGKVRDKIKIETGTSKEKARELTLSSEKIKKLIKDKGVKKTIFIKDKLINFVI